MFTFLCTDCSRLGLIERPDKAVSAACPYCGNHDIDWMSRPDLDAPNIKADQGDEFLCTLEKLSLNVLDQVYRGYDDVSKSPEEKKAFLEEFMVSFLKLLGLPNR